MEESDLVLTVLAMIDIVLVGSLIIMVMFSGYENFVSTIDAKGSDSLSWLGKLDAGTLKLKVAASIVAISSIHLLRIFMQVGRHQGDRPCRCTQPQIMWYVIVHLTFVVSAVLLGVLDKMSFAKHREPSQGLRPTTENGRRSDAVHCSGRACFPPDQPTALMALTSSAAAFWPSPYNMRVLSRKNSAFSMPENPAPWPRLMTMTFFALSAFRIGMP